MWHTEFKKVTATLHIWEGMHEGIDQITKSNGGRMIDIRTLDVASFPDDKSFNLAMSIAKDIPLEKISDSTIESATATRARD